MLLTLVKLMTKNNSGEASFSIEEKREFKVPWDIYGLNFVNDRDKTVALAHWETFNIKIL